MHRSAVYFGLAEERYDDDDHEAPRSTGGSTRMERRPEGGRDAESDIEERYREPISLKDVAHQIQMPFLIVHAEDDKVVPVASAYKLFEAIGSKRKELKIFKGDEGGTYHAQVDNRQVGVDYIGDWIAKTLQ